MFEKFRKKRAGFTIIELLVVIVIIGILAGIGIASINDAQNKAKIAKRDFDYALGQRQQHEHCLADMISDSSGSTSDCKETISVIDQHGVETIWAGYPANVGEIVTESEFGGSSYQSFYNKFIRPNGFGFRRSKVPPFPKKVCPNFDESLCAEGAALYDFASAFAVCPTGWKLPNRAQVAALRLASIGKHPRANESGQHWRANVQIVDGKPSGVISFASSVNTGNLNLVGEVDKPAVGDLVGISWFPPMTYFDNSSQKYLMYPSLGHLFFLGPVACVKE